VSAIDADAGDDSNEIDHVPSINIRMIADVRRFFCGQFIVLVLEID
jgi:hypothetical protein